MSTSIVPQTMNALVVQSYKATAVHDHLVPTISDDEVLVKVVAVALGPPDLRALEFTPTPGTVLGSDWAGEIVQVGEKVAVRKVGERVAGFVRGGGFIDSGAFAEYIKCPAALVWPIPRSLSFEEAATMSIGVYTCVQALYHKGRLELLEPSKEITERDEWVLVYGGSSSCGQYGIQLARASGYKVVTTSSPRNFDLLQSLGATAVLDYHDADVVDKIKSITGDSIRHVLDAIGLSETQELCQCAVGPAGGHVLTLLWANETHVRADVKLTFTLVHTCLGRAFDMPGVHFPVSQEDKEQMAAFVAKIPELVEQGRLKPNPVKLWAGGLADIPLGLRYLEEGKVSAEKIVFRI